MQEPIHIYVFMDTEIHLEHTVLDTKDCKHSNKPRVSCSIER